MNAKHKYQPAYQTSLVDPAEFWASAAAAIARDVPPTQIVDTTARPVARWFANARREISCFRQAAAQCMT